MGWFSGLVLLAVVWFMTLFVVLPLRLKTQGDTGNVVPGTPSSAPDELHIKRKFLITSIVAVPIWGVLVALILSGKITVESFDLFTRFGGELD
jgi:predicted secreted protein